MSANATNKTSCASDAECSSSEQCVLGNCFDPSGAQESVPVFATFLSLMGVAMLVYMVYECKSRIDTSRAERERRSRKQLESMISSAKSRKPPDVPQNNRSRIISRDLRSGFFNQLVLLYNASKQHLAVLRREQTVQNVKKVFSRETSRQSAAERLNLLAAVMIKKKSLQGVSYDSFRCALESLQDAERLICLSLVDYENNNDEFDASTKRTLLQAQDAMDRVMKFVPPPIASPADLISQVEQELAGAAVVPGKATPTHRSFVSAFDIVDIAQGVHNPDMREEKEEKEQHARQEIDWRSIGRKARTKLEVFTPEVFMMYPWFYALFFIGMLIVFLTFAGRMGTDSNDELQEEGGLLRGTFLPVPPYYNLKENEHQRYIVPLLYGIMHTALYCFCWLPVAFMRGIWRDVTRWVPNVRKHVPIDDLVYFHKLLGVILLSCLFTGAVLFMFAVGLPCREDDDAQACVAFDPSPVPGEFYENSSEESFDYDPFTNVLMLRKMVFFLWFPVMPLLHWAKAQPAASFMPRLVRQYWYETCYYTHHFIAHFSFITAMICRFDVFYLALIPWGVYYLDFFRETLLHTYKADIVVRHSRIFTDSTGFPISMRLVIEKPPGLSILAGQIVYLKMPVVSKLEWHPFSLASSSADTEMQLLIGVAAGDRASQWTARTASTHSALNEPKWKMVHRPTFTYAVQETLWHALSEHAANPDTSARTIPCLLRGPYGSCFEKCFDPCYTGVVVIGAGTGLTAALSVLRELVQRKSQERLVRQTPSYVWFIWSCRRTDDLLWCWETLRETLLEALRAGVLKAPSRDLLHSSSSSSSSLPPSLQSPSHMLDWLGVTIYVTQAEKNSLELFKNGVRAAGAANKTPDEKMLDAWLTHDRRLLSAAMDDQPTHIEKLLAWARLFVDEQVSQTKRMAVCFCGPSSLSRTVSRAARKIDSQLEFTAEHQ